MDRLHSLSLALAFALAALPAAAQERTAPTPAMAASMPMQMSSKDECRKAALKRHNHAAERGAPVNTACPPDRTTSVARKKPLHEHGKFNKQQ